MRATRPQSYADGLLEGPRRRRLCFRGRGEGPNTETEEARCCANSVERYPKSKKVGFISKKER